MQNFFTIENISENISETPEGFLLCKNVPIARTGELLYTKGEVQGVTPGRDGLIRITRDGGVLFSAETMDSFAGKAITVLHPENESQSLFDVRPENWKELACGTMQNIRQGEGEDADKLMADFLITDADAIQRVKSGLREVSCGYIAEYEETEPGKGVQTKIVGNHVALVYRGRCGSECAIQDAETVTKEGGIMAGIKEQFKALIDQFKGVADSIPDDVKPQAVQDDAGQAAFAQIITDLQMQLQCITNAMEEYKERQEALAAAIEALQGKMPEIVAAEAAMEGESAAQEMAEQGMQDSATVIEIDADTLSRAEIIAPGIAKSATIKADALAALSKTTDGASIVSMLTAGKEITPENIDTVFAAAAEIIKEKRNAALSGARVQDARPAFAGPMTPERLQEIHDNTWKKRSAR